MFALHHLLLVLCVLLAVAEGRRYRRQARICTMKDGKTHQLGEEWNIGHLHYKCNSDGFMITGCVLNNGKFLQVGQDLVMDNTAFRCYRKGPSTYYREYSCGVLDMPSCILEPINDQTSNIGGFQPEIIRKVPVVIGNLPKGWKVIDNNGDPIDVSPDTSGMFAAAPGVAPPEFSQ